MQLTSESSPPQRGLRWLTCSLSCFVLSISCLVIAGEGTVTWGGFPRGCEGTVIPSRLLDKGGAFAQRTHGANYYVVYPGNIPEDHPPTEIRMIHSKPHRGCSIQDLGICGYRGWKTADFSHSRCTARAQRGHSARCAPKGGGGGVLAQTVPLVVVLVLLLMMSIVLAVLLLLLLDLWFVLVLVLVLVLALPL